MSLMKLTLASLVATTLVVGVAGFACGRKADASPAESTAAATAPGGSTASSDGKWTAGVKPVGTYKKGEQGYFEVVVNAVGDFHVNDDYPTAFLTTDPAPANVTFPKTKLSRKGGDASAFTTEVCSNDKDHACVLHVKVPFTASAAGTYKLGGTLKVGMCSKASCLNEKISLDFDATVK